jgi:hypothetical protein
LAQTSPTVTELPGERIRLDAVCVVYALEEPELQPTRNEILADRPPLEQAPHEKTGPRNWWDRFQ